jgi:hypothetical protein
MIVIFIIYSQFHHRVFQSEHNILFDLSERQRTSVLNWIHTDELVYLVKYMFIFHTVLGKCVQLCKHVAGKTLWKVLLSTIWLRYWNVPKELKARAVSFIICDIYEYLSVALLPSVGPWPLFRVLNPTHTVDRISWTGDQSVTRPLPTHRINAHRHPCLEWDSNPRSQLSSERRRFIP